MNSKRIFAIIGIVLLVGLYVFTLIAAIMARPEKSELFTVALYSSVVIPCLIFVYARTYDFFKARGEKKAKEILENTQENK